MEPSEFEAITLVHDGNIVWITLNRPERLNALNDKLLNELSAAFDYLAHVDHRVVVINGAGRAFSAGYDIGSDSAEVGYADERDSIEDRDRLLLNIDIFMKIWRHPLPVITQVHGYCMGGASQLVVFSDITVVADDAVISGSPTLPIGGGYIAPLWSMLVGPKRAKLMSFDVGHRIDGRTAAAWGWATESVPAESLGEHVRSLALSIARTPASSLKLKKEAINRVSDLAGFASIARMGAETDALLHLTPEVRRVQHSIKERGLKGAIAHFQEFGID
ncbi:enoyl-CoA hydratase/isomerase family protein [Cryobacterium sp. TMS1-20-1]|uniref:enoyl-CoA hydratase-related protein n=1 Tax=Cryobacterium sp. TMS1-20-1 TaxID=1259223 RepID=UPI00106D12D1|nr:enoyl-CoA hydratase-related protein [Cryobacterium sp. TMS1-20-1]TFC70964.1 enoyl-CoA hydratase/isomerase family protein [Cryobacterium sp. TMS1-20-1]